MQKLFSHLSISTRLALWYGLSLFLLLSLFVVFLYTSFHLSLHHDFNHQMVADEVRTLSLIEVRRGRPEITPANALAAGTYAADGGTYVRILASDGEVLHRSANLQEGPPFAPMIPQRLRTASIAHTWGGAPARTVYTPLTSVLGEPIAWVEITRLESTVHRALHQLGWLLVVGVVLGTGVAMAFGHRLARRALRPVTQMTEAARRIQAEDLDRRLPEEFGARDELTELAETLNGLLARLDASMARERRFRADAAHEMFTPLSAIRSEIDVALRKTRESAEYEHALEAVRRHSVRLNRIVEDLLELSRAEALKDVPVGISALHKVAADVVDGFRAQARDENVELILDAAAEVTVQIDRSDLDTVVCNLIDNALKYTSAGGRIVVSITPDGRLAVSDTGVGFTTDECEHLFDRFYRANEEDPRRGCGLGLSIVQAIIGACGGSVEATSEGRGRGSTFSVRLNVA